MTTYPMLYTDNAFSWRRIGMLGKLYWPGLKLGFIICAILPFAFILITSLIAYYTSFFFNPLMQLPVSLLLFLSPIMLTKRDYRDVSAQLPVTATEKLSFLLLTFWIAVPATVWVSSQLGEWLSIAIFGDKVKILLELLENDSTSALENIGITTPGLGFLYSALSYASMITVVLYFVVKAKKNRILAAILSWLVTEIASSIVIGVFAAIVAIINTKNFGAEPSETEIMELTNSIAIWAVWFTTILMTIIGSTFFVLLYKRLKNSGF